MAEVIGDWIGASFKDFLILPDGYTTPSHSPESVDISANLAGVVLRRPLLPAAMRSVVGEDMALEASKLGMLPVVPRGLSIEKACSIITRVKENEIKVGEIESQEKPITAYNDEPLASVLEKVRTYGHSNIPVISRNAEFQGMFTYKPIEHDRLDPSMPVSKVMKQFRPETSNFCRDAMTDEEIKAFMKKKGLRYTPVLDDVMRLTRLVFYQQYEAYNVGGAIDTHPNWEKRACALVDAGADMIFTDTSDGYTRWEFDVIKRFKEMFPKGPPICAGNIVTADGFRKLAEAGADVIKIGMGSGSICTTNLVLGVGAPPFWALRTVALARDEHATQTGKYIPIIADGGIEDTWDINVALTHADAVMGGRIFACFYESAGAMMEKDGKPVKEYFGEGSKRAAETSGNMRRYHMGNRDFALYQGVDSVVPYKGRLKPGVEEYCKALRLALSHTACENLMEYRSRTKLLRLSEGAKATANVHGVSTVGE